MINSAYRKYKSNEIKATYVHEYLADSPYNSMLRLYNESMLLIKTKGVEVLRHKRFQNICKKFKFKSQSKDFSEYILAFKTQAYKCFIELLRYEYGIEENKSQDFEIESFECEKDEKDPQSQRAFNAYIGEGNNSTIVRNILKSRTWWNFSKKWSLKKWDFIWTQWIQSKIINSMCSYHDLDKSENPTKFVYNKLNENYHISNK